MARLLERTLSREPSRRPSAAYLAEALSRAGVDGSVGPVNLLNTLVQRRIPQIVAMTGAFGLAVLGVFDMLADRGILPETTFRFVLATVACLLASSGIVAWFHGQRGDQKVRPVEILLLLVVGVIWVGLGLTILMR